MGGDVEIFIFPNIWEYFPEDVSDGEISKRKQKAAIEGIAKGSRDWNNAKIH